MKHPAGVDLDQHVRDIVQWHFNPETGAPFWLDYAKRLDWDPRKEIRTYADLDRFGFFEDPSRAASRTRARTACRSPG